MDRSGTPLPSKQQVKDSVNNLNKNLKSTDTLVNDYNITLRDRINSNCINIKELNSFINTFSRENLDSAYNEQKLREHTCRLKSLSKYNDSCITVQKALALSKEMDLQYKDVQQIQRAYHSSSILRKPIATSFKRVGKSLFVSLPIIPQVNHKNKTNCSKYHDNGAAMVKVSISDRFTWNKTNQYMYTSIEKNPELIHNLTEHQLDFLQECFEKVCICSAEMYYRENSSESSSEESDSEDKEDTLNVDSVSDIIFNDNIYDEQDDIIKDVELQLSVPKSLSELDKDLENVYQSDDENYSSYLDFEEFSTSPKNILMSMSDKSNNDFMEEKPFIEKLFEKKLNKVQVKADCIVKTISENVVESQRTERLNLTPTKSHIKSEKTKQQNSINVLDQMIRGESNYRSGNFVDNLF